MGKLPLKKNWGRATENQYPLLVRQLDEMYTDLANNVVQSIKRYVTTGVDAPANAQLNSLFEIGDIYIRTDTTKAWIMTKRTDPNNVTWTQIT